MKIACFGGSYKVNKNALKEDLKNGIELPFAHLEQGRRLDLK